MNKEELRQSIQSLMFKIELSTDQKHNIDSLLSTLICLRDDNYVFNNNKCFLLFDQKLLKTLKEEVKINNINKNDFNYDIEKVILSRTIMNFIYKEDIYKEFKVLHILYKVLKERLKEI